MDVPQLVILAGDREIAANTLTIPHPYDESHAGEFLSRSRNPPGDGTELIFAIAELASDLLVGTCGVELNETHRLGEIGYWIGRPYWKRGYASEAVGKLIEWSFASLELDKIVARVFCGNVSSSRLLETLGLEREGILRKHLLKWGERRDIEQWGLLREQWRLTQRRT